MSGKEFERMAYEMNYLMRRADVQEGARMSITFDNPGDRARFKTEVKRELSAQFVSDRNLAGDDEFHFGRLTIRIL